VLLDSPAAIERHGCVSGAKAWTWDTLSTRQLCDLASRLYALSSIKRQSSGPEGSRKLRISDFMTTAQDGGKVVSLTHRPSLPPRNTTGIHFC
jgi:hypothetical protein